MPNIKEHSKNTERYKFYWENLQGESYSNQYSGSGIVGSTMKMNPKEKLTHHVA